MLILENNALLKLIQETDAIAIVTKRYYQQYKIEATQLQPRLQYSNSPGVSPHVPVPGLMVVTLWMSRDML